MAANIWRESFVEGDIVQTVRSLRGDKVPGKKEVIMIPKGSLLTIIRCNVKDFKWKSQVLFNSDVLEIDYLTEVSVNISDAKPKLLTGKSFSPFHILTRENEYFSTLVKANGGTWVKVLSGKTTHVIIDKGPVPGDASIIFGNGNQVVITEKGLYDMIRT